jgi:hypothetical protein
MKMNWYKLFFALLILPLFVEAQKPVQISLNWTAPTTLFMGEDTTLPSIYFEDAAYPGLPDEILPYYVQNTPLPSGVSLSELQLSDITYVPLSDEDKIILGQISLPSTPEVHFDVMLERAHPVAHIRILPFGVNPQHGVIEKVESFTINFITKPAPPSLKQTSVYADNSVLAMGDWYKMYISESGIYRVTYDDLKNFGINMNGLNPDKIRIFGNGGAMLNTTVGHLDFDDLTESALKVVAANQGVFAPGDYVLFYGQGTLTWSKNPLANRIDHSTHLFADEACYFLTIGPENGRRIATAESPQGTPDFFTNEYTALYVYEKELNNLIKSGRKWFDVKMDYYNRTLNIPRITFTDLVPGEKVQMRYGVAGRSTSSQITFNMLSGTQVLGTVTLPKITSDNGYGADLTTSASFLPASGQIDLQVKFNPSSSTDLGWFDFVAFNAQCYLRFGGGQFMFRNIKSIAHDRITEFTLSDASGVQELWDVTNPRNVSRVDYTVSGGDLVFKSNTADLREFVAFDGSAYKSVRRGAKVANQNLHSTGNYDLVIVAHPDFMPAAQTLATAHNEAGDVSAVVVPLPEIYNEFSSGIQDITAIRNYMKMLYDRGLEAGYPKYLLLFGNASYDLKDRIAGNTNFVPTFHNENSVNPTESFLTDDYYVLLDQGEGGLNATGMLDLSTGRMPVRTQEQANVAVAKSVAYLRNDASTHGDWRNSIMVIADDKNKNAHLNQAEGLTSRIARNHPVYNIEKIYFDAYKMVSTPGGARFPDVNRELVSKVEKGALIVNYIGHGGEVGWADERVLEIADINAWTNFNQMGLFFTATCEFSRFDNPVHTSAGELVFLNPDGGATSMITTTRLAWSSANASLNLSFADTAFNADTGVIPRLGDILKYTKNKNGTSGNTRHLTLFGDPALRMSLPQHRVFTTAITDALTGLPADTLFANSLVTVSGIVKDVNDQFLSGFNGELQVKVFDKPSKVRTLGQDQYSYVVDFNVQKSILYQGKATVKDGAFTFTFPVPKDIDYSFGLGKLSYYVSNGTEDGHGFSRNLVIGGSQNQEQQDFEGPKITLFMNDTNFIEGGITSENPKLLAFLYDESGINTVGNGIGHDIVATIDDDSYSSVVLNDFYSADMDSYQRGSLLYQYFNLPDGEHSLTLKAWDVFNNSASASITFEVKRNIILNVDEILAYPNPTNDKVSLRFGHNQFDGRFDVEISVFNTSGMLVRTIGPLKVSSEGYESGIVEWDGKLYDGSTARAGLYLVRLKVRSKNGNTTSKTAKVVVAR